MNKCVEKKPIRFILCARLLNHQCPRGTQNCIKNNMRSSSHFIFTIAAATIIFTFGGNFYAHGQETQNNKIPLQTTDERVNSDSLTPLKLHRFAFGANLDFFPTILSAIDSEFGLGIQPWFGVDHFKIRLDIRHMRIPDSLIETSYFHKNIVNTFSVVLQYCFGNSFDGFVLGAGIGAWNNMITLKYYDRKGSSIAPYLTIEGGYIWRFYSNMYMEPSLSLDVMLTDQTITVYGFHYKPLPVFGEITLKFGIFVDF